jgi:hypothetical protein
MRRLWLAAIGLLAVTASVDARTKKPEHEKAQVCGRLLGSGFCNQCGCKGGPGYRGPSRNCVGWDAIGKCGNPPSAGCTAEIPHATLIPKDWPPAAPRQAPVGEDCKPLTPEGAAPAPASKAPVKP